MKFADSKLSKLGYPVLLDGGLSNQLESMGYDLNHKLWSAKLLDENPNAIIEAHSAYLKAGAEILITSSYQASIDGLLKSGFSEKRSIELIALTVELAKEAIKRFKNVSNQYEDILIASSLGPYGAFLADASEYTGNYGVSRQKLVDFHMKNIRILDQLDADFIACETIPSITEAQVLGELLRTLEKPAWVSFSCMDGLHINDGTPLSDVISIFDGHPNVFAVGINCTKPEFVMDLLTILKRRSGDKKIVVYPNSGEVFNPEDKSWSGMNDPLVCAMQSSEWIKSGADIIGGCCRIGPEHIQSMRMVMDTLK